MDSPSLPWSLQARLAELSESPRSSVLSNTHHLLGVWKQDLAWSRVLDLDVLEQALDDIERNNEDTDVDQDEKIDLLAESGPASKPKATVRDEDEAQKFYGKDDKLSGEDVIYDTFSQEDMNDDSNHQAEIQNDIDEPLFVSYLFSNPLQALEDQENGIDVCLPRSLKPVSLLESPFQVSKTWLTRFLTKKPRCRRRMPGGPGKFVVPSGSQALLLIVYGISINGVRPTSGETVLRQHRKLGRYVSFSSPLRHCWTYAV